MNAVVVFLVMMSTNCPQYDNMKQCLAMFNNVSLYYTDYYELYRKRNT